MNSYLKSNLLRIYHIFKLGNFHSDTVIWREWYRYLTYNVIPILWIYHKFWIIYVHKWHSMSFWFIITRMVNGNEMIWLMGGGRWWWNRNDIGFWIILTFSKWKLVYQIDWNSLLLLWYNTVNGGVSKNIGALIVSNCIWIRILYVKMTMRMIHQSIISLLLLNIII